MGAQTGAVARPRKTGTATRAVGTSHMRFQQEWRGAGSFDHSGESSNHGRQPPVSMESGAEAVASLVGDAFVPFEAQPEKSRAARVTATSGARKLRT